ncbi:2-epi-5-epi-valiolone synthase [Streptomyces solincola]|uniref:2-epi-5-epi-valiolone synthase n=1 Tax=Streptomyces solincola TaxID=2100817 RepID=A0A2S9Q139_9ACTN|nr:sedoheptulose 7-phosphate cyclase [Streptomyces solincola]PRH80376.1 2-epi-5-epi-valiolone synthase [Streptomyces solincola]
MGLQTVVAQPPQAVRHAVAIPSEYAEGAEHGLSRRIIANRFEEETRNMMDKLGHWTLRTSQDVEIEVSETPRLLDPANPRLAQIPGGGEESGTRLVIVDEHVEEIFGQRIREYFSTRGAQVSYLTLPAGDEHKTIDNVLRIASRFNEIGTERTGTPPIVMGGGVVQDVAGLAATLYRRGIPYVRVPTTLLGQIDGSVSAKNGVNFEGFRNRLGTFNPPPVTLIDRTLIASLPERQVQSGLGEALKMALIKDAELFRLLEEYGPDLVSERLQDTGPRTSGPEAGRQVMHRAITGMAEELEKNLWERDLLRIVDYGHTFSPAVEMRALPDLLHGEAVAMGCLFCAVISAHRGLLSQEDLDRIVGCVRRMGLHPSHPMFSDVALLRKGLADTVRHRGGAQHLTLLTDIGQTVFVEDLTDSEIDGAAHWMGAL